jgi:two-component system OmpR family sensor kinase
LIGKATELNHIVNDLLTAARIEGGTVTSQPEQIDLREIARQAIARAEARAGLLKGELFYSEPDHPVLVEADREQLGRVIDNLINNALTYSASPPSVSIRVSDAGAPSVSVEDNGIGIPLDKTEKIFERFFRIDDPSIGPQPGTGLGLFISRDLVERHGGSLVLEGSELGKGSTFTVRLPAASSEVALLSLGEPRLSAEGDLATVRH